MEICKRYDQVSASRNNIFTVLPIDASSRHVDARDNGENIIKTYLQFGYYVGLVPFKIGKNKLDGKIFLHSNKFQKVFPPITYAYNYKHFCLK